MVLVVLLCMIWGFNQPAIKLGVEGTLRVMAELGMRKSRLSAKKPASLEVRATSWVRARRGGILRLAVHLGQRVAQKEELGVIADAFGDNSVPVAAPFDGVVIAHTNNPMVHQGDSIVNLAEVASDQEPES